MKKWMMILLAVLLILMPASCNTTPPKEETPSTTEPEPVVADKNGVWSENTYSNEFINIAFSLPEGFSVMPQEELLGLVGDNEFLSEIDKENFQVSLEQANLLPLFMVVNSDTGTNLNCSLQSLEGLPNNTAFTEDVVLNEVEKMILAQDKSLGFEIIGRGTQSVAGKTYQTLEIHAMGDMLIQKYHVLKEGDVIISFVLTTGSQNIAEGEAVMAAIQPLA